MTTARSGGVTPVGTPNFSASGNALKVRHVGVAFGDAFLADPPGEPLDLFVGHRQFRQPPHQRAGLLIGAAHHPA